MHTAKNCLFLLPVSHSLPPLPMFPLECFAVTLTVGKLKSHGISSSEDRKIVAGVDLTW